MSNPQRLRRLTLGVIGHVDHGKTSLVRALTGTDTDRLPEEKRRGISIALGFAHARFGEVEVDFIDMPGHERFVRTLVSGATGVDAALLVVAANEGVKPQTLEHLDIAALLGLKRVLVAVTKADLVEQQTAAQVGEAAAEAVRRVGLEPIVLPAMSITVGSDLAPLHQAIVDLAEAIEPQPDDGFPYLPIDRAFSLAGHGTVVTGTLRRGELRADAELVLTPGERPARVRGLQVHGRPAAVAWPGQRVAVNLRGVEPADAPRGSALIAPGLAPLSTWLSVELRAVVGAGSLRNGTRLMLLFGTAEVEARLRLLDRDTLEAGMPALAQLDCTEPVSVLARERFVLRIASPAHTVAGGIVLDPAARRRRRRDAGVLAELGALVEATPEQIVLQALKASGASGASLDRLSRLAGVSPGRARVMVGEASARIVGDIAITVDAFASVQARIRKVLAGQAESQPNGIARRRLAALVPHVGEAVLDHALSLLAAEGVIRLEGGVVRLPPRRADAESQARQVVAIAQRLVELLRQGGLGPPDVEALAPTPLARRVLDQLAKDGRAVRTFDRVQKREVFFHPDAVADAQKRLRPLLGGQGLSTGEIGAALGMSRKFSVPLLEYLDVLRFTRRQGDRRMLGPQTDGPPSGD
ncbi:selenocysteine-specific translation elongation factor [Caulobacter sp. S45]|uniref:selenocysteine-specific translation elongation factor n=1 Tax=Caulobacter sp. S45 TaxID=1641861 RepID=UPI00131D1DDD|nr:selenocysteine-specific translation elongation factor [Caulobacter sp. S45]